MILKLRKRHRMAVCALAIILPTGFAAGILARRAVPVHTLSGELAPHSSFYKHVHWIDDTIWPEKQIRTVLRADDGGSLAVELTVREPAGADVLVYWSPGEGEVAGGLPENAQLLGALANREALAFPESPKDLLGRFVLYSLADHRTVATSKPVTLRPKTLEANP